MASIVDKPKESSQHDLLEIEKYTNGLIKFINSSATPITIGIQGEWGSGKTSLLNTIREELCGDENGQHYSVWLNTWEYSLLSSPDETLIKIISGLVSQISELTIDKTSEKGKKAAAISSGLLKSFSGVVGGIAGKSMEIIADGIDSKLNKPQDNSIKALRVALQDVVDEAIKSSDKRAFIFFIDDLDRLDPAVAVSILELIKNLFDLKNCIFVLAIDYSVVIKGLQSKFGKMTEENEWEFRAFFDKIIQLPFSMPISSYNISKYVQSLLIDVEYFTKEDLNNSKTIAKIAEIVSFSVGTNPRALKRLANSVSLIEIIRGDQEITAEERVIEFALICIQIAYPTIYSLIQREPDFTSWDEQLVYSILRNKKIDMSDLENLKDSDEFDEEWEQNLWKICQSSSFLKERSFLLSRLLNFIKENIPDVKNEEMNETLERLLSMSSVTSVSADSAVTGSREKYQKIKYDGWESYANVLAERNIPDLIITNIKVMLDAIENELKENVIIAYAPSGINIKNIHANGRRKVFIYIHIQKKQISFAIFDSFTDSDAEFANKYPERIVKGKYINFLLNQENNFNYQKYMPLIREAYEQIMP